MKVRDYFTVVYFASFENMIIEAFYIYFYNIIKLESTENFHELPLVKTNVFKKLNFTIMKK